MHDFTIRLANSLMIVILLLAYNQTVTVRAKDEEIRQLKAESAFYEEKLAGEASSDTSASAYRNGTYDGTGQGFGGPVTVRVTVSGGKMTDISILSHDGEDGTYFGMAEKLTDTIVARQTTDVDSVSGATFSSKGIKSAVDDALSKAVRS